MHLLSEGINKCSLKIVIETNVQGEEGMGEEKRYNVVPGSKILQGWRGSKINMLAGINCICIIYTVYITCYSAKKSTCLISLSPHGNTMIWQL